MSPGTSVAASIVSRLPVAEHERLLREVAAQRLDRPLGLPLLREGEDGVEHDHGEDRAAEHRRAADEGERGGEPEQERERVRELLARAAAASGCRHAATSSLRP